MATKSLMRRHPVLILADKRSWSERIADSAVAGMGSIKFIVIQTVIVALWITANVIGWSLRWDVYPFILLNLMFSTQAAYAAPLILLAGRRADAKRDALANHHYTQEQDLHALINGMHQLLICLHAAPATGKCTCKHDNLE